MQPMTMTAAGADAADDNDDGDDADDDDDGALVHTQSPRGFTYSCTKAMLINRSSSPSCGADSAVPMVLPVFLLAAALWILLWFVTAVVVVVVGNAIAGVADLMSYTALWLAIPMLCIDIGTIAESIGTTLHTMLRTTMVLIHRCIVRAKVLRLLLRALGPYGLRALGP